MHPLSVKKVAPVNKSARTGIVKHKPYVPLSPISGARVQDWVRSKRTVLRQEAWMEVEYIEEMIGSMKQMEKATQASPEMMDMQPELEWYMRPYLIDFLMEVHAGFRLQPATLYLTVNLMDRYMSKRVVFKKHYQLLGCAALWIAAKYEESKDRVPTLKELCTMCCDSYREEMFVQMESHIIKTLDWVVGHPTAYAFLQMMALQAHVSEKTIALAQFFTELALFHRDFICASSTIAEASLFLAQSILQSGKQYAVLSSDVIACIHIFQCHLTDVSNVVLKKYSHIGIKKIINDYLATLSSIHSSLQTDSPHTPSPNHKHSQCARYSIYTHNCASERTENLFENTRKTENGLPTPPVDDNQCNHYANISPVIT